VDEPAASIEDVGGQEEMTAAHLMGSSPMEDSRALQIDDAAAAGRREDEQLTQVSYLFTSLCLLFLFVGFQMLVLLCFTEHHGYGGCRGHRHHCTDVWIYGE